MVLRETTDMTEVLTLDALKDLGSGHAAPGEVVALYRRAFAEHGPRALWNCRQMAQPTIVQALAVASALRTEGNLAARHLAIAIEQACRAAV